MRTTLNAIALVALVGCTSTGHLTGRWVFLTSGSPIAVGQADQPTMGGPLHLLPGSAAAGSCLPPAEYDRYFGATCPHETEGDAPGTDAIVHWYCHGSLTVRVRFDHCERADRLRVVEIAVSTVEP